MRAAKFAKYLPENGYAPIVVSCDYEGNFPVHDWPLHSELIQAGVEIHHVKPLVSNRLKILIKSVLNGNNGESQFGDPREQGSASSLSRFKQFLQRVEPTLLHPDRHLLWTLPARRAAERLIKRRGITTVLTSSPPPSTHLVGLELKRRLPYLRWIADFRDLWSLSPDLDSASLWRKRLNARLESQILSRCDQCIFVSKPILEMAHARLGLSPDKGVVITNGFDPTDFDAIAPEESPAFTVSYVGAIFGTRTENRLLEGIARFLEIFNPAPQEFQARFVGTFDNAFRAKMSSLEATGHLRVETFVPHNRALAIMRGSDALVLILPDTEESRIAFTGKFFEYLASHRPILALAPPGCVSAVMADQGLGQVVDPNDVEGIASALGALLSRFRSGGGARLSVEPKHLACFDRRHLAARLAAVLNGAGA